MPNPPESAPTRNNSTGCAQTTPSIFGRLTKAELITLLEGRALRPLTDAEFTRGAAPGYVTRVSKRSVLLRDGVLPVPAVPPDATRLPYKD